jgi:hypothetical protein
MAMRKLLLPTAMRRRDDGAATGGVAEKERTADTEQQQQQQQQRRGWISGSGEETLEEGANQSFRHSHTQRRRNREDAEAKAEERKRRRARVDGAVKLAVAVCPSRLTEPPCTVGFPGSIAWTVRSCPPTAHSFYADFSEENTHLLY